MSISQLSDLTGVDRKVVSERLRYIVDQPGPKNAKLYCSAKAIPAIMTGRDSRGAQHLTRDSKREIYIGCLLSHFAHLREDLSKASNMQEVKAALKKAEQDYQEQMDLLPIDYK